MKRKYKTFTVAVPIEEGGQLYKQLEELAKKRGISLEHMVEDVVILGLYGHIEGNLKVYERLRTM